MCNSLIPAAYRAAGADPADAARQARQDYPPAPEPLPVPVMDNHTHLDFPDGESPVGIAAALDAAQAVGVQGAVQVGCDLESSRFTVRAVDLDSRLLGQWHCTPTTPGLCPARRAGGCAGGD
ncbi:tatd family protein [Arthrobacter sp. Hiyo4]|nr:tatd family protein [Arthrobacter sp. Hiyo4]